MPLHDKRCVECGKELVDVYENSVRKVTNCECGGQLENLYRPNHVIGDEIDVEIKHALCNADGTPRRFRSRQELNRAAKAAGYTNYVEHLGTKGGDKSKHTQRWV